jgi:amino acid adenylation domain-containing protein
MIPHPDAKMGVDSGSTDLPGSMPATGTLPEMILQTARRNLNRRAIQGSRRSWSYGELQVESLALASALIEAGVDVEDSVGLAVSDKAIGVVSMLSVMLAGGTYVPLDLSYPPSRLDYMIERADIRNIIVDSAEAASRFAHCGLPMIEQSAVVAGDASRLPHIPSRSSAAYIIFTSGSTGKPKGVIVEHGSLATYTINAAKLYDMRPDDRVLQFASLSFDWSVAEIWPTLLAGATLVVGTSDTAESPLSLVQFCDSRGVTVAMIPTAYWQLVVDWIKGGGEFPPTIRLLATGAERVPKRPVSEWREIMGDRVRLLNGYGPTEATVEATTFELAGPDAVEIVSEQTPIGKPLKHAIVYILDEDGTRVPPGEPGELVIGGEGVARGYVADPKQTAERFSLDSFAGKGRIYRTGDIGRLLPDGNIEFLGRVDNQVKIRGYRVELADVESAFLQSPLIRNAAAVPRERDLTKSLVLFFVPTDETVTTKALRQHAEETLPHFMRPAHYVPVEELPISHNGKIDRDVLSSSTEALPILSQSRIVDEPNSGLISRIAAIWQQVLGASEISMEADFFAQGGDSLAVIRVIGKAKDQGISLRPRDFTGRPTISALAAIASSRELKGG